MILRRDCKVVLFMFGWKEGLSEKIGAGYHFINDHNLCPTKPLYSLVWQFNGLQMLIKYFRCSDLTSTRPSTIKNWPSKSSLFGKSTPLIGNQEVTSPVSINSATSTTPISLSGYRPGKSGSLAWSTTKSTKIKSGYKSPSMAQSFYLTTAWINRNYGTSPLREMANPSANHTASFPTALQPWPLQNFIKLPRMITIDNSLSRPIEALRGGKTIQKESGVKAQAGGI